MSKPIPGLSLRAAEPDDIPVILGFIRELAEYERLTHEVVADEARLSEALFGPRPAAEVVVAELDGEAAGFALYFVTFSTFLTRPGLYLEDLYVKQRFRGRGIGKALLSHLARLAVERDYGRVEWAVLDWNSPAIDFYERMQAVPMSDWIVYRLTGDALRDAGR
jgi:GNAT superfamily N-acetyltransferase